MIASVFVTDAMAADDRATCAGMRILSGDPVDFRSRASPADVRFPLGVLDDPGGVAATPFVCLPLEGDERSFDFGGDKREARELDAKDERTIPFPFIASFF